MTDLYLSMYENSRLNSSAILLGERINEAGATSTFIAAANSVKSILEDFYDGLAE